MNNNLDFTDSKNAFSKVSTLKLRKEIFLFKIMNSPLLSKISQRTIKWALKNRLPIDWLLKITVFEHFCGGQSVDDCKKTINRLSDNNITTILDYSKEHGDESTYDKAVDELMKTIAEAKNNNKVSFAVFKFTSIADMEVLEMISKGNASNEQEANFNKIFTRVNRLCQFAFESDVKILIDAEHSWIQPAIDMAAEKMMILYNKEKFIVFNTIQLYRHDRLDYLKNLHKKLSELGIKTGVKLVRGAYMDIERERALQNGYSSPIHTNKNDTDRDYDSAIQYCTSNLKEIAICAGTHNQKSSELLVEMIEKSKIIKKDDRIYFAQLLGMADHISNNLGVAGYNVAKYVPYGKIKEVIPYLFRRADENKSVAGEMSRELKIRKEELKRRKMKNIF